MLAQDCGFVFRLHQPPPPAPPLSALLFSAPRVLGSPAPPSGCLDFASSATDLWVPTTRGLPLWCWQSLVSAPRSLCGCDGQVVLRQPPGLPRQWGGEHRTARYRRQSFRAVIPLFEQKYPDGTILHVSVFPSSDTHHDLIWQSCQATETTVKTKTLPTVPFCPFVYLLRRLQRRLVFPAPPPELLYFPFLFLVS